MVGVVFTDEARDWYLGLDEKDQEAVFRKVGLLEQYGVTLGYPHSSEIKGGKIPLRELRIQSGGRPLRAFYLFDATRDAIVLCGGDKTGDDRFYDVMVTRAENIWKQYLEEHER
jgi:hypothetical protein